MDIVAKCSECGEDVEVRQDEVYAAVSACKSCNTDVKLWWRNLDGIEQETILKNK